jgi:hypothetical protein
VLAVASTLAGTLTLFGSVANVIVMESAGSHGDIGFWRFLRYGLVLTLVDLTAGFALLGAERWLGIPGWLGLSSRGADCRSHEVVPGIAFGLCHLAEYLRGKRVTVSTLVILPCQVRIMKGRGELADTNTLQALLL